MGNCVCVAAREKVSKQKRRCVHSGKRTDGAHFKIPKDGVNLDLVLVRHRMVAMGFPATGKESLYRNPFEDVKKFLDFNYGPKYMVYNLCAEPEHQYDASRFNGRVQCFPFADHFPPPLQMMADFVASAMAHMHADDENTVVVHCKAGKGRTGVMLSALMLAQDMQDHRSCDPNQVIREYGERRAHDGKGLTHRSQIRYVVHYAQVLLHHGGVVPPPPAITITGIRIVGLLESKAKIEKLTIDAGDGKGPKAFALDREGQHYSPSLLVAQANVTLVGDVAIALLDGSGTRVGGVCFYTAFAEPSYEVRVIDKLYKVAGTMPMDARLQLEGWSQAPF